MNPVIDVKTAQNVEVAPVEPVQNVEIAPVEPVQNANNPLGLSNDQFEFLYEALSKQVKHEDGLISSRLTWIIVFQGFLFNAFVGAHYFEDRGAFPMALIAILGILTALAATGLVFVSFVSIGDVVGRWDSFTNLNKTNPITRLTDYLPLFAIDTRKCPEWFPWFPRKDVRLYAMLRKLVTLAFFLLPIIAIAWIFLLVWAVFFYSPPSAKLTLSQPSMRSATE